MSTSLLKGDQVVFDFCCEILSYLFVLVSKSLNAHVGCSFVGLSIAWDGCGYTVFGI